MLLDGAHLLADALDANVRISEAAIAAGAGGEAAALAARLERAGIDVVAATAPVLAALSPVRSTSSIVALAERPACDGGFFALEASTVVMAIGVQDPGNLGAIVRVAEAGGAAGVVVTGGSADPFGWKALRGSMGSALRLPIVIEKRPDPASLLRERGFRIIATSPRGGRHVYDADLTGPIAVLIGGEGPGLDAAALAAADERVTIPMRSPVESLNAAVTAALVVYESMRQRSAGRHARQPRPAPA